ncbi:hypothetical protein WG907_03580 [Sphingobium sp. AN558]|uniref:hypothetical protein n=1 Tax=Sphingobium sp. AN558 TaxID=3133442 RepID=UPI0030C2CA09
MPDVNMLTSLKALLFPSVMPARAVAVPASDGGDFAALLSGTMMQLPAAPVDSADPAADAATMDAPQEITPSTVDQRVSTEAFLTDAASRPPLISRAETVGATTGPVMAPIVPDGPVGNAGRAEDRVSRPGALKGTDAAAPPAAEKEAAQVTPSRAAVTFVIDADAASAGSIQRRVATPPERIELPVDNSRTETPARMPGQSRTSVQRTLASEPSPAGEPAAAEAMATPIEGSPSPEIHSMMLDGDAIVQPSDGTIARALVEQPGLPARAPVAAPADEPVRKLDDEDVKRPESKDAPGAPVPGSEPLPLMVAAPVVPVGPQASITPARTVAASLSSNGVGGATLPLPASAPDTAVGPAAMVSDDGVLPIREPIATRNAAAPSTSTEALDPPPVATPVIRSEAPASSPAVRGPLPVADAALVAPSIPLSLVEALEKPAGPVPPPGQFAPEKLLAASPVVPPAMPPRPNVSDANALSQATGNIRSGTPAQPFIPAAPPLAHAAPVSDMPSFAPIPVPSVTDQPASPGPSFPAHTSKPQLTIAAPSQLASADAGRQAPDLPIQVIPTSLAAPEQTAQPAMAAPSSIQARAAGGTAAHANSEGLAEVALPSPVASADVVPPPALNLTSGTDKPVKFEALSLLQLVRDQFRGRLNGDHEVGRDPATKRVGVAATIASAVATDSLPQSSQPPPLVQTPNAPPVMTPLQAAPPVIDLSASIGTQLVDMGVSGQWIDGLARDIAGLSANGAQGRFQINTEQLGSVQVDIRRDVDGAAVSLTVATEAAELALHKDRDRLQIDAGPGTVRITELRIERAPPVEKVTAADPSSQQSGPQDGTGWQATGQGMGQSAGQGRWQTRENFAPAHKASADVAVLNHAELRESAAHGARRDAGGTRYA